MATLTDFSPNCSLIDDGGGNYILNVVIKLPAGYIVDTAGINWDDTRPYEGTNPVCNYADDQILKVTIPIIRGGVNGGLEELQHSFSFGTREAVEIVVKEGNNSNGRDVELKNQSRQ
ncbi:MAG: hypothetical protein KDC92_17600 [Bacteroidetes bacterium]|nr:hypothetical protein [Bacteroidota bacterium]